jgi:formylglycine-generating enzyme required for sulfatase activity
MIPRTQNAVLGMLACGAIFVACATKPVQTAPPRASTSGAQVTSSSGASMTGDGGAGGADPSGDGGSGGSGGSGGGGGSGGDALAEGPSCTGGLDCGGTSCCQRLAVPGGTFPMGRSLGGSDAYAGPGDELSEHLVTVSGFALDAFEVTVGRFRKFVDAFDGTPPAVGAGAHPLIANSGWRESWSASLADSRATLMSQLSCSPDQQSWSDAAGAHEDAAINCVSWFEAAAFCAWDGGRLPTEAEWEYAASGGKENRLYPWGGDDPVLNPARAASADSGATALLAVGSHPAGNGRWGHRDLAGGELEWNLDWYDAAWYGGGGVACVNCADINGTESRVLRGGSWLSDASRLRAAARLGSDPAARGENSGFRCARGL